MKWQDARKQLLQNPQVQKELQDNEIEYQVAREIIRLREGAGLSQKDLAALLKTQQANISRLESGKKNTTIATLAKIAKATGKKLKIHFV